MDYEMGPSGELLEKMYSVGASNYGGSTSLWGLIKEPFAGAWQRNIVAESRQNILAFSAVYACVALIAEDIAKLRIKLMEQDAKSIWTEVQRSDPFSAVLRKPNRYQTRIQFLTYWLTSKLLYGNAYILKERSDARGLVTALYCLDPRRVTPMVASDGSVFYDLSQDELNGVPIREVGIPASEIIHDRCVALFHPLVGISPIYACGASATQGIRIQANSATFFENMSRPSGQLTSPSTINDDTAIRLKRDFEANFGGGNVGKLLVTGDGLKYEPMSMPPVDAQLVEQLKWTVEDVARAFRVPLHKLGLGQPTLSNVGALNQDYYNQCLQNPIESIELLLDEGLGLLDAKGRSYGVELDLDGLLRMDPLGMAETQAKSVGAGVTAPNEARLKLNLSPVKGGEGPYLQQQNFSLAALAKRDALADPFAGAAAPKPPAAANDDQMNAAAAKFLGGLTKGFEAAYA